MRRVIKLAALALAGTLMVAGCGDDDNATDAGASPTGTAGPQLKVGLAYDIGGRGDQSFNDAAAAGLDRAKTEFGLDVRELEATTGESNADKEERLRLMAQGGFNPIIGVGFAYAEPLGKVAKEFPDTEFAIVDDASDASKGPNIANLTFAEHEGSFLVGVIAALKSTSGTVGFVGGVEVPLIKKFEAGFKAGVEAGKAGTKVQSTYLTQAPDFSGFTDPAKGKTAAEGQFDAGADVVYHAAGGSGGGVFQAAQAAGKVAIGVDSDQYLTADPAVREVIITSMLKKVDVAVYDFIEKAHDDAFTAGETVYDLKAGGIDYSTSGGKVDDIKAKVDDYKQKIISGEITVPTTPAS